MIGFLAGIGIGVLLGTISGLLPGIHVNTMAGGLLALQLVLIPVFGPEMLAIAMVSALITHTFLDIIPSTFLGIPDADTALSVIPAHAMCLEGKGEEAVRIAALGSVAGFLASVPVALALLMLAPFIQGYLDWAVAIILTGVVGYLVFFSESPLHSGIVFLVSGMLGLFTFQFSFMGTGPLGFSGLLMPLLSGLFGISLLLVSGRGPVPHQHFDSIDLPSRVVLKGTISGTIAGIVVGWLPGLSNATANSVVASVTDYNRDRQGYLFATNAANTVNAVAGLAAFYAIARTRNGVMVALSAIEVPPFSVLLSAAACAAVCAYLLTILIASIAWRLGGVNRTGLTAGVIVFITLVSFLFCGVFGLFILLLATLLGLVPKLLNIPQVFCMGAVTLPVILFSLGYSGF
ncbi:MAG: tripartite tricarboxylate transporter permease [Methanolinea sp.]|nr:tripartite tricarboxylate transporter permease [Methanolinea sp.]